MVYGLFCINRGVGGGRACWNQHFLYRVRSDLYRDEAALGP